MWPFIESLLPAIIVLVGVLILILTKGKRQ
jgi:hypothetical protein